MKLKLNYEKFSNLKPFHHLGIEFVDVSSTQAIGICPLCDKKNHFYVNKNTGQWDCKSCGEEGNIFTFLSKYARQIHLETTDDKLKPLVRRTGLPLHVFKDWSVGWDGVRFLAHCRYSKDTVTNIALYNNKGKFEKCLWGLPVQLYGMYRLKEQAKKIKTVWVVEGCKDAWTLSHLLRNSPNDIVVAVPGAGTFKPDWAKELADYKINLCYDHDNAGRKGTQKALSELTVYTKNIEVFEWPKPIPFKETHGYDINDFYKDLKKKYNFRLQRLNRIKKRLKPWKEVKWVSEVEMKSQFVLKRRKLSDIKEEPINWLWKNWIAKGFVNLMVALIGQGKSTLIQKFIADITSREKQRSWPNGLLVDCKGSAILLSAEEDIARTIRPRIRKFGGDADKIEMPPDLVDETTGEKAFFNILQHRHSLEKLIQEMPDLQIVVFDPAVEYISKETDINTEMQIREVLRILQDIAEEHQIAIVAVAHVNKDTSQYFLHRILGAQAFGARVRIVLGIADNPDFPDDVTRHILAHCKTSLGPRQPPIGFQITQDTDGLATMKYDSVPISNFNIKDLFSPDKKPVGRPPRQEERAEEFLKKILESGHIPRSDVIKFGEKQRLSESTIKRAVLKMNIKTKYINKGKYEGQYCWKLPTQKTEKKRVLRVKKKIRKN